MTRLLALAATFALLFGGSIIPAFAQSSPAEQAFAQLDINKDGKLSQTEFVAHPNLTSDMFGKWDSNGDKFVSQQEFVANYGKQ